MIAAAIVLVVLTGCASQGPPSPQPVAFETGVASCAATATPDSRFSRPLLPNAVDAALMDRAVRFYTNRERCRVGVGTVDPDRNLATAAAIHAGDMAAAAFVAPARPADPTRTLARRYELAGVGPYEHRGENLMRISLVRPGFEPKGSAAGDCAFATGGMPLALHPTHGSVARRLVKAWMASEAMRASLLAPEWTHMGAAVGIRPVSGSCGDLYAAQSFRA